MTAAFTRNLFARMNRELGTDVPTDAIDHVAYYDAERERIEIFAEARRELTASICRHWAARSASRAASGS